MSEYNIKKPKYIKIDHQQIQDWAYANFSQSQSYLAEIAVNILISQIGISVNELKPETKFADLNADYDNFDAVSYVIALETEFNLSIPDNEAEQIQTLRDLVNYLAQKTTKK